MFNIKIDDDLELRSLEKEDGDELFTLIEHNREYLREWLPWVDDNTSVEDSKKFIESSLGQSASGIWYKGKLAGVVGYSTIDQSNRKASIGYWLGASFQGHGLMTKACRAMIEHSFSELDVNRIEIHCAIENSKSRAIPERLGFVQEGVIRQGQWVSDSPCQM
jgi:ribosomal-protein-serine acetyltransferase